LPLCNQSRSAVSWGGGLTSRSEGRTGGKPRERIWGRTGGVVQVGRGRDRRSWGILAGRLSPGD